MALAQPAPKPRRRRWKGSFSKRTLQTKAVICNNLSDCTICVEPIKELGQPDGCKHDSEFCFKCLKQWSETTNCCPLCKARFTKIVKRKNYGRGSQRRRRGWLGVWRVAHRDQQAEEDVSFNEAAARAIAAEQQAEEEEDLGILAGVEGSLYPWGHFGGGGLIARRMGSAGSFSIRVFPAPSVAPSTAPQRQQVTVAAAAATAGPAPRS
ncbi:unnamed protein product, partial [Heterosigma akashiwo]